MDTCPWARPVAKKEKGKEEQEREEENKERKKERERNKQKKQRTDVVTRERQEEQEAAEASAAAAAAEEARGRDPRQSLVGCASGQEKERRRWRRSLGVVRHAEKPCAMCVCACTRG
jgi:outer membrane biosynthesis protein TonB